MVNPSAAVAVLLIVGMVVTDKLVRRYVDIKVRRLYGEGRMDELLCFADSWCMKYAYPSLNRSVLRLNAYQAKGDADRAEAEADVLMAAQLPVELKLDILRRAFGVYVENQRRSKALQALEGIDACHDDDVSRSSHLLFDVVLEHDTSHIEELEASIACAAGPERMQMLYLLSVSYASAGDATTSERYLEESRSALDKSVGGML